MGGQKKIPLSPFWLWLCLLKIRTQWHIPACGYWDVYVPSYCLHWIQCKPPPLYPPRPPTPSFECSFKNSQKDFPKLTLMDVLHLMSVQTDRISGEQRVWYSNFVWSKKTVRAYRRQRLCMCATCGGRCQSDLVWLLSMCFFGLLSSLHLHCLAPLRENLATTTAADCRKPKQPYDALHSVTVDYVKYRGCPQFIGMMMYRLVFLKGITVYLGRENDGMTHCRLIWLADQKMQAEVGYPLSIVFQWDLAT